MVRLMLPVNNTTRMFTGSPHRFVLYKDMTRQFKRSVDIFYLDELGMHVEREQLFGVGLVETETLINYLRLYDAYADFESYHRYYMSHGDVILHDKALAVILDFRGDDIIYDGWHRFHGYVYKGVKQIPVVLPLFGYS